MNSLLAAALAALILAQVPSPPRSQPPPEPEESFWEMVLRISGISATPSTSKGPGDAPADGDVWLGQASGVSRQRLTRSGGYSSPIFEPDDAGVLALRGRELVRISTGGDNEPQKLFDVAGVIRLIGFHRGSPRQILVLTRGAREAEKPGLLDLDSRKVEPLPVQGPPAETVARLMRWDRIYQMPGGPMEVTVQLEKGARGQGSWTDVYLKPGKSPAVNVSRCNGERCGQPALSHDGGRVVFIRALR